MPEGGLPGFNVPTTAEPLKAPGQTWEEFFGDPEEQQFYVQDVKERHLAVLLQDGLDMLWLARRLSGTLCPYWSDEAGQCRDPLNADAACYNTKWVGGYHAPMQIKVALPSAARQTIQQQEGQLKVQPMRAWTIWTPKLNDRDMLVNPLSGERFEVLNVQEAGPWRGLIFAQQFDMRPMTLGADLATRVTVPGITR